jgi:tRNA(Ile)-lysidine synthase
LEKEFLIASNFDYQKFNWVDIKGNPSGRFFIMEFLKLHYFNYSILDEIWDSKFSTECKQWKNGDGQTLELKGSEFLLWFNEFEHTQLIIAEHGQYKFGNNQLLELKIVTSEHFEAKSVGQNEAHLDYSKIKFPLTLLPWEAGDEMATFGLKGKSKKISDLLTDRKMSLEAKKRVLKLQDAKGEIIWLPGIEVSFTFRIEKETSKIARLSLVSIKSKLGIQNSGSTRNLMEKFRKKIL